MHKTNIRYFLEAASIGNNLLAAYCSLVALELVLKSEVSLKDHDVCNGLNKLGITKGIGPLAFHRLALLSLSNQLRSDISAIHVNDRDGLPRLAPPNSYPYIRYTRIDGDGWGAPTCVDGDLVPLLKTLNKIRAYLRVNFGCML